MTRLATFLLACLLALGSLGTVAAAHEQKLGDLVLHHAWSRANPAGAKSGAVFVTIENTGDMPDQLLSASSDVAAMTEIHQMSMENDIMVMKPAGILDIPAHGKVELKPHGLHIMLMGLKQRFAEGDTFSVTLTFAKAGSVTLQVVVDKVDAMGSAH
ncbi:copper chaperone PCu(A)C [Dongia mobilis]|uniref:copper chaperone PCu(A)C n=1 Tax=Dongia sp. TaxID=1977262 RepID=UPI0026EA194C